MQRQLDITRYSIAIPFQQEMIEFLEEQGITYICAYRPPESWYDSQYNLYPFTSDEAEMLDESVWIVRPILSKEVLDMDNSIDGLEFKIHFTQQLFRAYQQSHAYGR